MQPQNVVQVLVAGAGPVGLTCALTLASRGIAVRIVDPHHRAALHSYALALHPRTLRVLDEWGLTTRLMEHGQVVRRIALHHGAKQVATLELAAVGGAFPFVLVVPQVVLEAALEQRLAEEGVRVERGPQLLAFDDTKRGVRSLLGRVEGAETESAVTMTSVRSSYLVAADGGTSPSRRLLGIGFAHVGRPAAYRLLEFEAPLARPDEMHLVLGANTTDVLWPLGPNRGRFGLEIDATAPASESTCDTERAIRERAPWLTGRFESIAWHDALRFEPRLAQRFGRGHAWLAGDAAHYTNPVGVQSMNVGLREAQDLGRRIASMLHGTGGPKLLRYYNEDRAREWKLLLGLTDRLRAMPRCAPWARELGPRLIGALPATGGDLNRLLNQARLRLNAKPDRPFPSRTAEQEP